MQDARGVACDAVQASRPCHVWVDWHDWVVEGKLTRNLTSSTCSRAVQASAVLIMAELVAEADDYGGDKSCSHRELLLPRTKLQAINALGCARSFGQSLHNGALETVKPSADTDVGDLTVGQGN